MFNLNSTTLPLHTYHHIGAFVTFEEMLNTCHEIQKDSQDTGASTLSFIIKTNEYIVLTLCILSSGVTMTITGTKIE